jgi:hypothetical protein
MEDGLRGFPQYTSRYNDAPFTHVSSPSRFDDCQFG